MNLIALAPSWLIVVLCAALVAAAVEDIVRLRISNVTVLVVMAGAVVSAALAGPSFALWENAVLFVAALAIGTLLFSLGMLGGGDIKLFAALALWIDLERSLLLLLSIALVGGVLAIVFICWRILFRRGAPTASRLRLNLPYGVAIAAGALFVIGTEQIAKEERHRSPLEMRPLAYPAQPQR